MKNSKPHVCFVGLENLPVLAREYNNHGIGGEQVQQTLLAKAFARRGYRVSMVTGDYGQPDGQVWDGVTTYKAFRPTAGLPVLRFAHPRWTGLHRALGRADADIYYFSCAAVQLGQVAMFARLRNRRFVFRVAHDTDCVPESLMVPYWRDKALYAYGLRRADAILVQSEQQQRAMQKNYGLRSKIAGMLVDRPLEVLSRDQRDLPALWVNNIRQFKRPDLYLELSERVPRHQFHMIGGTQPGFESLYEQMERRSGDIPNLQFHGRVPYHDINEFYARSLVFVNTSDSEGFPNSYLQAWVRGTPLVAFFDPDGLIVREGLGVVVKTMEEMAAALEMLMTNRDEWQAMSDRCLAYMERQYGEDAILEPYVESFKQAWRR